MIILRGGRKGREDDNDDGNDECTDGEVWGVGGASTSPCAIMTPRVGEMERSHCRKWKKTRGKMG